MFSEPTEEEKRKEDLIESRVHASTCAHLIDLLKIEPDYAIMLEINGVKIGLCNNEGVIELLKGEIEETKKCIEGKDNKFA